MNATITTIKKNANPRNNGYWKNQSFYRLSATKQNMEAITMQNGLIVVQLTRNGVSVWFLFSARLNQQMGSSLSKRAMRTIISSLHWHLVETNELTNYGWEMGVPQVRSLATTRDYTYTHSLHTTHIQLIIHGPHIYFIIRQL